MKEACLLKAGFRKPQPLVGYWAGGGGRAVPITSSARAQGPSARLVTTQQIQIVGFSSTSNLDACPPLPTGEAGFGAARVGPG